MRSRVHIYRVNGKTGRVEVHVAKEHASKQPRLSEADAHKRIEAAQLAGKRAGYECLFIVRELGKVVHARLQHHIEIGLSSWLGTLESIHAMLKRRARLREHAQKIEISS